MTRQIQTRLFSSSLYGLAILGMCAAAGCGSRTNPVSATTEKRVASPAAKVELASEPAPSQTEPVVKKPAAAESTPKTNPDPLSPELADDEHLDSLLANRKTRFTPPFKSSGGSLFAPPESPKASVNPVAAASPIAAAPATVELPAVRLLGFADVDGRKALVEFNGAIHVVGQGEMLDATEVTELEAAQVNLKLGNDAWTVKLFDQPWLHEGSAPNGATQLASSNRSATTAVKSNWTPPAEKTPVQKASTTRKKPRTSLVPGLPASDPLAGAAAGVPGLTDGANSASAMNMSGMTGVPGAAGGSSLSPPAMTSTGPTITGGGMLGPPN